MDQQKFIISHSGPMGSRSQHTTAAAFFARKNQSKPSPVHNPKGMEAATQQQPPTREVSHVSNFAGILSKCPPPAPSGLLKRIQEDSGNSDTNGHTQQQHGKVRVVLRVANSGVIDDKPNKVGSGSCFQMDQKKRQVTLLDPTHARSTEETLSSRQSGLVAAPKMFAFDGLFTDEDCQSDVAGNALTDTIHGVVTGVDGCLFAFGHASLGKTYTMIGSDESSQTLGVIPSSIAWLFRAIKERKETKNVRFAVRVSALSIGGQTEEVRDLLTGQAASESDNDAPPSQFFPPSKSSSANHVLANLTELRCSTAERAGYYLDAALTARSTSMAADVNGRDSHFIFTLHVYQYSVESGANVAKKGCGVIGGRSRLHLVDFGCCDRTKTSGGGITLSGLGNVILGIFNGQRHLPFKESKVTQMLKECLGSFTCQATMLAHVTPEPSHYSETLHTTQLASRIHRMRRKKAAKTGNSSGGGSGSGGSSDDTKMNRLVKLPSSSSELTSTDPSSSEQSCDTVIYVGSRDDEGTDAEHPPVFLPALNCGDNRGQMAKVLRGSTAELPMPHTL
jgi:kinesin family protein 26